MQKALRIRIDGSRYRDIGAIHDFLSQQLDFGRYYGRNLDALWDRMTADVARPLELTWVNAAISKQRFTKEFERMVEVLKAVEHFDAEMPRAEKFRFFVFDSVPERAVDQSVN